MQGVKWLQAKQALLGAPTTLQRLLWEPAWGFPVAAVGTDGRHVSQMGMRRGDGVRGGKR